MGKVRSTSTDATLEDGRSTEPRDSPMMAHLLTALEAGNDIGHYGRLVFVMVAHHFMSDEELVKLLSRQPEMSEDDARGLVMQVKARGYSPPKREKILAWQRQQDFPIIPDPEDPDSGNVYRELRFPDEVYDNIGDYYEEKAEAH